MARTKKYRSVQMAPPVCGFKPQGLQGKKVKETQVSFAEYEALKLCDYELLQQEEAAALMNVSRPTFTRIYQAARQKVAQAFVEGSCIRFDEGKAHLAKWYQCAACNITFTAANHTDKYCPLCKSPLITQNCTNHDVDTHSN